jgi:cell division protein FtsL
MKTRIVSAMLVLASAVCLFAQAEKVKGKAKDLKKKIEAQQTNQVGVATNAPVKK